MKLILGLVLSLVSFQALALDCSLETITKKGFTKPPQVAGAPSICAFQGSHESIAGLFNGIKDLWLKTRNSRGVTAEELQGTSWRLNSIVEREDRWLVFDIPTEISFNPDVGVLRADLKFLNGKSGLAQTNIISEIKGEPVTNVRSAAIEFDIPEESVFSLRQGHDRMYRPRIAASAYFGVNNPELLFVPLESVNGGYEVIAVYVKVKN